MSNQLPRLADLDKPSKYDWDNPIRRGSEQPPHPMLKAVMSLLARIRTSRKR